MSDLAHHIEHWLEKGVISERTAEKILKFEGLPTTALEHRQEAHARGRMISVIAAFGGILLGVGVLIWVGTNWAELSVGAKLIIICIGLLFAHAGAYVADEQNHPAVGRALALAGSIIFSSGLFLVAQMFHTNANPSLLFLIAAIGVAPVFIFKRDQWQGTLLLILLVLWSSFSALENGEPTTHYWMLPAIAILFALAWQMRMRLVILLTILVTYLWYAMHLMIWVKQWYEQIDIAKGDYSRTENQAVFALILLLIAGAGLASILCGHLLEYLKQFNDRGLGIIRPIGYLAFGGTLFFASFNELLFNFGGFMAIGKLTAPLLTASFLTFVLLWVLLALLFVQFKSHRRSLLLEGVIGFIMVAVAVVLVASGSAASEFARASQWEFHPLVLPWNILLLGYSTMLVCIGYFRNEQPLVTFGVVVFALQVFARYFDTFALRLGTATSFVVGGFLLLALAVLLGRLRTKLLARMQTHHPSSI